MFRKLILHLILTMTTMSLYAQAPQSFNYQAVVRDNSGELLSNQSVSLRISILEASASGNPIYIETHNIDTDSNGLIALEVGLGIANQGTFSSIDWGSNLFFVQVELDLNGQSNFSIMGTTKLNSVPYAMYADKVNMDNMIWSINGDATYFDKGRVGIGKNNPEYDLDIEGDMNANEFYRNGSLLTFDSLWQKKNNNLYFNDGYIGVGTETPDHHIEINANATGDDGINRQFISVRNLNNTFKSYSAVGLSSGTDTNKSDGAVGVTALSYTALPNLSGMTYVSNNENGVAIRARNSNGKIKFWTGGDGASFERMTILGGGNIGINKINPNYQLDIDGAVNASEYLINGNPAEFSSPWELSSNDIFYNDGYIGVGTETPDHHIEINANATGDDGINRQFISVRNFNNTFKSYSAVGLSSGTDINKSDGALGVTALSYTALPNLSGMTYVSNNENGVAIRARDANGKIKFWTGGDGEVFERMTISSTGDIGISNTSPNSKLQVSDGDIYIDQIGSGVIMTSPNGQCWRMTVDNLGQPVFNAITCP